ncbi:MULTISPECIES: plasmid recombination protein, partial [Phocaeicola]
MDEKTPHIHAAVVPIVTGERRKAKKEQTDGKRKYRKKTNSVRLCADDLFNRQTLVAYHDNYARVMAKYGLQRGVRGSEARHTTTMQYYRDLKKKNEVLETETRLLQEKKAEAQEELKQVKAEIRTDKLKNAATDTATALASSVGSLFGSGKMKSLERRNEDLQDRILELENEARQRERQQAKQIQEIRNAYEQQHRKLSEFADFVRRYFPYVEKLMPIINFLRDRLKFNDGIIRRLCEFKEVGIKGELYSSEFNRSFDTRHSVCSIKQDENGKFDFKIDGVSHVNWFRKKMNEFREAIGIPKPRQNRSMKL